MVHLRFLQQFFGFSLVVGFSVFAAASDLAVPAASPSEASSPTTGPLPTQIYTNDASETNVLKAPPVFILGKRVITKAEEQTLTTGGTTPTGGINATTPLREMTLFSHTPRRGTPHAPVKLVELTDLSCLQCYPLMQLADEIYQKYAGKVAMYHLYLPVDMYNITNIAAFYGQLAHQEGAFWAYREALYGLDDAAASGFVKALVKSGVTAEQIRKLSSHNARRFYKQLDADAALSKSMGEERPPVLFINGTRITAETPKEEVLALVEKAIAEAPEHTPQPATTPTVAPATESEAFYGKL